MYPTTQPLGGIARPATDALSARLARQNRSGSGITAIERDNGTPFLTNRPEVVDELSAAEVGRTVEGAGDPRQLLRDFIVGNDNVGRANAANRDFALEEPGIQNKLRAQGMVRAFDRGEKRADVNSAAATQFDRFPSLLRENEQGQAQALADIKNQGDYVRAAADRYKADTDFDIAGMKTNADADSADFRSVLQGYGDTMSGLQQVQDPAAREQGIAPIRSLLIRLLQGMNANATQQP